MTYEESILLLGNLSQKLDALARTFLEIKEQEDQKKKQEERAKKTEKKPSRTEKILAPVKGKKEDKKQLKISDPAKSIQILVKQEKDAKDKGQLNLQEKAPKVSETLTSTERKRWENIGNVVATAFKKIFEGREKAKRTAVASKEIKDIEFSEEEKLEKIKTGWFTKLLLTLGILGGFVLGFISEAIRQLRKIFAVVRSFIKFLGEDLFKMLKAFRESKIVKFITGIFDGLKSKFLNFIKIIRESNTFKFLSKVFDDLKGVFSNLAKQIRESKLAKNVVGFFDSFNKRFLNLIESLKNSKFSKTITSFFDTVNKRFLGIIDNFKNIKFKFNFQSLVTGINVKLIKAIEDLKSFKFKPTPSSVLGVLNSKFLNVLEIVKNNKFVQTLSGLFQSLNQKFLNVLKIVRESKLMGFVQGLFTSIYKDFLNVLNYIQKSKLGTFITNFFKSLETKFLNIGKSVNSIKEFKFLSIFKGIGDFFSRLGRIIGIIEAGKGPILFMEKVLKPLPGFLKAIIDGPVKIIFKGLQIGIKFGRLVGKFLIPLAAALELFMGLFKAFTDTKLSDKSFIQKLTTGIIAGIGGFFDIFSIFGLEFFNFDEIRDRIEKIFKPFREGKWIQGIGQILNQVISWFLAVPGKILGWVVGWFSKDLGKKITNYYRNFDLFEWIKGIVMFVPNMFMNMFKNIKKFFTSFKLETVLEPIKNIVMFVPNFFMNLWTQAKSLFAGGEGIIANVYEVFTKIFEYSPMGLLYKGAQKLINMFTRDTGESEGFLSKIFSVVENIFGFIPNTIKNLYNKAVNFFKGISFEGVFETIKNTFGFIPNTIKNLYNKAVNFFKGISFEGVFETLKNILMFVPNIFKNLYNKAVNFFKGISFEGVFETLKNILMFVPNIFKNLYNNVKSLFGGLGFEGVFETIKNILNYVPNLFKNLYKDIINFFGGFSINNILDTIQNIFYATPIGMMIKWAGEIIKYFSEFGIVEGVKRIGEDIKNKFFGIFDFVSNVVSKIFEYIKEKIRNIPLVGKYLVSDEKTSSSDMAIKETKNISGPAVIQQQVEKPVEFDTESMGESFRPKFETQDMFSQQNPENVYAMEKGSKEPKTFDKFKGELEGLNKNSTVTSKIAVDQLREIKNLNGRMQEMAQMMLANRTLTVNNVSNRSVNAFIHPSTVNNFRNNYRE